MAGVTGPHPETPRNPAFEQARAGEPAQAIQRSLRQRRLLAAIISSLALRPLSVAASLAAVALFLPALGGGDIGQERYGLCLALAAIGGWLSISGGLGQGLVNQLSACYVSGDRTLARQHVTTMFAMAAAIAGVTFAAFAVTAAFVPWANVLSATTRAASERQVLLAVYLAGALTAVAILAGVATAVYTAYQEVHLLNAWEALTRLGLLAGAAVCFLAGVGVPGAVAAMVGGPLAVRLAATIVLFGWQKPWLRPSPAFLRRGLAGILLRQGTGFFLLQLCWIAQHQTGTVLVAIFVGPAEAAIFGVVTQLSQVVYSVFLGIVQPQWPAYGEALSRGDWGWVKASYRATTVVGVLLALGFAGAMLVAGDMALDTWTRGAIDSASPSMVAAISATIALRMWVDARSTVLSAAGVVGPQLLVYGSHALLGLALGVLFAGVLDLGAAGVAWAQVVGGLATSAWGYAWLTRRFEARVTATAV
jgi:O-antigen/teichoic acid export membrane protein